MGSLTSVLTLRLVDQVTGPASTALKSIKHLDAGARRAAAGTGARAVVGARSGGLAVLGGRALLAGGAALGGAKLAKTAVTDFAALDRRMTYVGMTADATAEQTRRATLELKRMSQMPGSPGLDKTVEGLESLVAAGRTLPEAMSFLPSVTRTAVAANASVEDIATSADALASHFKIAGPQMQSAFDTLVAGGKLGKFELKDMARFLPSLGPAAAAVGFKGAEGLKRFVAVLQTIRAGTGTAEEAAASAMNVFSKMESDETAKKFSKFGIDLRKEMAKARKEGKDLFETFITLANKAVKGDMSKLPQLFTDMEFARGMRALMTMPELMRQFSAALKNVDGSTLKDFNRVAGDAQDKLNQLSAAFENFKVALGEMTVEAGGGGFLDDTSIALRAVIEYLRQANDEAERLFGKSPGDFWRDKVREPARAKVERMEAERADPFRKRERQAQEELDALETELAKKRKTLAGNPVGALFIAEQIKALEQKRREAVERRDLYRGFTAPGVDPVRRGDLPGGGYPMGGMGTVDEVSRFDAVKAAAGDAGAAAMASFNASLEGQMSVTLSMIDHFVAQVQGKLSFTASPTIAPHFVAPAGVDPGPGSAKPQKKRQALTGSDARRIVRFEGDRMYRNTGLA